MNISLQLEKMIDALNISPDEIDTFLTSISSLKLIMQQKHTGITSFVVPQQANFQLPDIFLRTKQIPECEKFMRENSKKISIKEWNENIDNSLNIIAEYELEQEEFDDEDISPFDDEFVKNNIQDIM
ncbi:hypothetical protein EDEG_01808 [Edhazardia aedis USNM 41457]|uniref:Uncharacterized protein n=1 Tax=Edhazardia aedis (strain USNM 41457) TaxID=1003232 RepID=J8ZW36_EDHAE|nr:hypothetical protein EDEG_01808 [Edhazardia aedis USNM 41457]|eukprot:EJW03898.1 hypothetical protein EDEG_01808 [Edhazardia aedis USNM 41457]